MFGRWRAACERFETWLCRLENTSQCQGLRVDRIDRRLDEFGRDLDALREEHVRCVAVDAADDGDAATYVLSLDERIGQLEGRCRLYENAFASLLNLLESDAGRAGSVARDLRGLLAPKAIGAGKEPERDEEDDGYRFGGD